ncbi:secreted aspartic proteinase [Seiridium cupressi]
MHPDTLKNITLGVYNYANTANYGSLGLGFGQGVNSNRSNVVDELVSQGATQAKAFGLSLGTNNGPNEGSLVLGGIDTKKFSGALQRVPVIDPPTYPFDYSEYSYLPLDIVNEVAAAYSIRNTSDWMNEWYIIPCRYRDIVQGSVDLHFGALNVSIPYSDFIISSQMLEEIDYTTAPVKCYLSIFPWDENFREEVDFYYLGHTFLRAVYAVYDQDNRAVWLANRNDCGSDIKGITKDESSISGVKGQCNGPGLDASSNSTSSADKESSPSMRFGMSGLVWVTIGFAWVLTGY